MAASMRARVWAFTRRLDGTELLVLANLSRRHVTPGIDPTRWTRADTLLTNYPGTGRPAAPFSLRPWEVVVYHRLATAVRSRGHADGKRANPVW